MNITDAIKRARELDEQATEGGWVAIKDEDDFFDEADFWGVSTAQRFPLCNMREDCDPAHPKVHPKKNATFIATTRNAWKAAVDVIEAATLVAYPRGFRDGNVPDDLHRALTAFAEAMGEK